MKKQVAIVHFNTPELTEACIHSIRRHGGQDYRIVVFDNSDKRPFPKMKGVEVFDNTKGQIFNFDQELAKYPNKDMAVGGVNNWGSDKHMMSVQALWDLLPEGFMLIDSDVLIKESFDYDAPAWTCADEKSIDSGPAWKFRDDGTRYFW